MARDKPATAAIIACMVAAVSSLPALFIASSLVVPHPNRKVVLPRLGLSHLGPIHDERRARGLSIPPNAVLTLISSFVY
jgi:hypothetical protein